MTLRCDEIIITIVFLHYLIMMDNYSITVGGSTVSLLVWFETNSSHQNNELLLTTTDNVYAMTLCYAEFNVLRKSKYGEFYSFLSTRLRLHIILFIKMIVCFFSVRTTRPSKHGISIGKMDT